MSGKGFALLYNEKINLKRLTTDNRLSEDGIVFLNKLKKDKRFTIIDSVETIEISLKINSE